jgi:hypothetical protein
MMPCARWRRKRNGRSWLPHVLHRRAHETSGGGGPPVRCAHMRHPSSQQPARAMHLMCRSRSTAKTPTPTPARHARSTPRHDDARRVLQLARAAFTTSPSIGMRKRATARARTSRQNGRPAREIEMDHGRRVAGGIDHRSGLAPVLSLSPVPSAYLHVPTLGPYRAAVREPAGSNPDPACDHRACLVPQPSGTAPQPHHVDARVNEIEITGVPRASDHRHV